MEGDELPKYRRPQDIIYFNRLTTEYMRQYLYNPRQMKIYKTIFQCSMMILMWLITQSLKLSGTRKCVFFSRCFRWTWKMYCTNFGTGQTQKKDCWIALYVASSGISSTLIPGGRSAHDASSIDLYTKKQPSHRH